MPKPMKRGPKPIDPLVRFVRKQKKNHETGCRDWMGGVSPSGYGRFRLSEGHVRAHRWFWEYFFGPVPKGMELHHICENRRCVQPDHLVALSPKDHGRQHLKNSFECRHPYEVENISWNPKGSRRCKTCVRDQSRRYYWALKGVKRCLHDG